MIAQARVNLEVFAVVLLVPRQDLLFVPRQDLLFVPRLAPYTLD